VRIALDPHLRRGDELLGVPAMPHRFDPTVLREYDIRGVVGATLFAVDARALGRVFAQRLVAEGGWCAAVGYDGRLTSPELEAALVAGLAEGGVDVLRIGRGPTPMLYFAAAALEVDGGLMVTGSHNPPDHNGFKLVLGGKPFYGEAIQQLGEAALTLGTPDGPRGRVEERSAFDDYVARLACDYDGTRGLNVALSGEVAIIKDEQAYYHDIVTLPLALSNDGKPVPAQQASLCGLIPKGAKNVEVAKDFLSYLIQPKVLNEYLKTGLGRNMLAMPAIVKNDPWWLDPKDPHRPPWVRQGLFGPTVAGRSSIA
jgi:hypothetical protein